MENIKIIKTQDGSIGLYNETLEEIYHAREGAKTEAYEKFVAPALIFREKPVKILDICYGIGYNTKCALENFKNIIQIDCVETDRKLAEKSPEFPYGSLQNEKINETIKKGLLGENFIHFHFDDIRKIITKLDEKYDVIFHDGFAPKKQPELWSEELIFEITKKLSLNGIYLTYNHSKPVLAALLQANLTIGKTLKENRTIGTIASFDSKIIQNPLSEIELGALQTKSAITFKDRNLDAASEEILKLREDEVKNSNLESLSHYLKFHPFRKD